DGLVVLALIAEQRAEVRMTLGIIGPKLDRAPTRCDRLFGFALITERRAEVTVGLGKIGSDSDSVTERNNRFVCASLRLQGCAEIGEVGRVASVAGDRAPDQIDR